ncbi:flagellar biosynthetic protein FliO [Sphingomonas sp. HITSZ_GF]|uniref:flagellar biosynthetic protein FliO n=1 Tax=Sphingomonas sp. HITSZ_GF TaxID=3037247 RepID=UPI00240DDC26|nr:flagellar biosynthetic protein FliO [Sphingomonas sp. HITSZ_GF]MDG2533752.1 flagellar biosynthetic protein FliO [Sphingomonas sp. HITSZ_GF]
MTWYIIKLIVLLPLVCGLLIGCLYAWRKLEARLPKNQQTRMVQLKETMMLSPGLRLAVIEFEGQKLLVSVSRSGVTLVDKQGQAQARGQGLS